MRLTQPWLYMQVSVVAVCCVYCKQEKLLFTTANNIQEIDLDTLVVKELVYQSTESYSLAYDEKERYVYSSRLTENTIVRFPYPNDQAVNSETVVSTNRPYYVAFDSGNSHLYWTELNTLGRVVRCKSDGSDVTTIVNGTLPIALALDTHDRWIYYSTETSNALLRVTFDGTERQVVINLSSRLIDIQVDFVDQRVYWMEYDTGDLKSVLNNGSDVKTVMSTYVKLYNREIDIGGDYIFYTSYKNILKVHKSSGKMPTVVHTEQVQIDGLLFYKLKSRNISNFTWFSLHSGKLCSKNVSVQPRADDSAGITRE
ncbi:low-density lipoprotein receptor-related protein 5-like [Mytilus edulis]|uniref:low-density lipoprotein receptor-related protein 5-like n=1 Tax=Mytilus edulis TaxID=6550 RepID=UPI0039EE54B4